MKIRSPSFVALDGARRVRRNRGRLLVERHGRPGDRGATTGTGGKGTGGATTGTGGSGTGRGRHRRLAVPRACTPPMPQAVTLKAPSSPRRKIVGITFSGDPLQGDVDTFVSQNGPPPRATGARRPPSTAWKARWQRRAAAAHERGRARGASSDGDVQAWLTSKINAGGGFPQPDANTMYVIFYPSGTTVTMGGGSLCREFQGYHSDYAIAPGQDVVYAVVGRCPPPVAGLAEIDEVTAEASHELIEMATDPLPQDKPAYAEVDTDHTAWALVGRGGEIGDLWRAVPHSFFDPPGITTLVQRVWSNKAAAAGHDPCQPAAASPNFNPRRC